MDKKQMKIKTKNIIFFMVIIAIAGLCAAISNWGYGFDKPERPDLVSMSDQELIDYARKEKNNLYFLQTDIPAASVKIKAQTKEVERIDKELQRRMNILDEDIKRLDKKIEQVDRIMGL
jgi:hypothetical protein